MINNLLLVDIITSVMFHSAVRWQRAPGAIVRKENVEMTPEDGTDCFCVSFSCSLVL